MKCSYVKPSGKKYRSLHRKEYFICHTSYVPEKFKHSSKIPRKKMENFRSSAKLTHSCPSSIELVEKEGRYKAILFTPHVGHECSLKHINLSTLERAQIAGLLKSIIIVLLIF